MRIFPSSASASSGSPASRILGEVGAVDKLRRDQPGRCLLVVAGSLAWSSEPAPPRNGAGNGPCPRGRSARRLAGIRGRLTPKRARQDVAEQLEVVQIVGEPAGLPERRPDADAVR